LQPSLLLATVWEYRLPRASYIPDMPCISTLATDAYDCLADGGLIDIRSNAYATQARFAVLLNHS